MEPRISIPGIQQLAEYGLTVGDAIALYGRWCFMTDAEKRWFMPVCPGWKMPEESNGPECE